jgi:predicted histidine transporter YuiF (NhaC family)
MKKYLKYIALVAIAGLLVAFFIYNKPHENIKRTSPAYEMAASEIYAAYEEDESTANEKYLDKVISVSGEVLQSKTTEEGIVSVTLDGGAMLGGVICQLDELSEHSRTEFEVGEKATFKGKCTGMLMDVVLVRCVEVN